MSDGLPRTRTLVTGANRGLGLGIAAAFAERGDHVFATCRTTSPELEALGATVIDGIELTSDRDVARLPAAVGPDGLDIVVCNAGINEDGPGLEGIRIDALGRMFDVNALGSVRVALALLDCLREGAKILFITTGGLSVLNVKAARPGQYGYRMSKAALVSFGHNLALEVRERGIAVALVSPGAVDTPLLRGLVADGFVPSSVLESARDALVVGRLLRERVDALEVADSPAWLRTPEGAPVLAPDVLERIRG